MSLSRIRYLPIQEIPFLVVIAVLHVTALVVALSRGSFLTDDSIQYLTLAENLLENGVFSQSYTAPFVPDIQRVPGYPVFLLVLGRIPWLVLLVQHGLVLLSGRLLFLLLKDHFPKRTAILASYLYLLMPYPVLFASMILSETLFICLFLLALKWWSDGFFKKQMGWLGASFGVLALSALVKPVAIVAIPVLGIASVIRMWKERQQMLVGLVGMVLATAMVIGPWMMRNERVSGHLTFTSMSGMGMLHGRLGGLEAARQGKPVHEHHMYMAGDSIAALELGLPALRDYYTEKQNHEAQAYPAAVSGITFRFFLAHPLDAAWFELKSTGHMLAGVGYGWSKKLFGSNLFAFTDALFQGLLNLLLYVCLLISLRSIRKWPWLMWVGFALTAVILLSSAAGWADGRYRMIIDPLMVIGFAWVFENWASRLRF